MTHLAYNQVKVRVNVPTRKMTIHTSYAAIFTKISLKTLKSQHPISVTLH